MMLENINETATFWCWWWSRNSLEYTEFHWYILTLIQAIGATSGVIFRIHTWKTCNRVLMSLQDNALLSFSYYLLPLNNNRTIKQYVVHSDNQIDIKTNKTKIKLLGLPPRPHWLRPCILAQDGKGLTRTLNNKNIYLILYRFDWEESSLDVHNLFSSLDHCDNSLVPSLYGNIQVAFGPGSKLVSAAQPWVDRAGTALLPDCCEPSGCYLLAIR